MLPTSRFQSDSTSLFLEAVLENNEEAALSLSDDISQSTMMRGVLMCREMGHYSLHSKLTPSSEEEGELMVACIFSHTERVEEILKNYTPDKYTARQCVKMILSNGKTDGIELFGVNLYDVFDPSIVTTLEVYNIFSDAFDMRQYEYELMDNATKHNNNDLFDKLVSDTDDEIPLLSSGVWSCVIWGREEMLKRIEEHIGREDVDEVICEKVIDYVHDQAFLPITPHTYSCEIKANTNIFERICRIDDSFDDVDIRESLGKVCIAQRNVDVFRAIITKGEDVSIGLVTASIAIGGKTSKMCLDHLLSLRHLTDEEKREIEIQTE
jgi:hypothetical protein